MLLELSAGAAAGWALAAGYAVRGRSAQIFGKSIWHGPRRKKQIALTFDDGPSEETPRILELLDTSCVRATFFQCGQNVDRLPDIARQVRDLGHEIGNHTYSHPRLIFCSRSRIREEIDATQKAILRATGVEPRLFRAPYGIRWFGLRQALQEHGLTGVMWSVIAHDWEWEGDEIARHLLTHVSKGGIICLHDGDGISPHANRHNTVLALRHVIPKLYERGYSFVTAGEMLDQLQRRVVRHAAAGVSL